MKIQLFEEYGLKDFEKAIQYHRKQLDLNCVKEMLKTVNITFAVEDTNRLISTLLCELGFSYIQQSQRYVKMDGNGYEYPFIKEIFPFYEEGKKLIEESFDLYQRMTEVKEGLEQKGRPKMEDYKYGIPIEDGRYILPLTAKTNLMMALSGTQLLELIIYCKTAEYKSILTPIMDALTSYIGFDLVDYFSRFISQKRGYPSYADWFYKDKFSKINSQTPVVLLSSFKDPVLRIGLGAATSTSSCTPSENYKKWGEERTEKARQIAKRVIGYGHESISEQSRFVFGMMMSLTAYHQFIRHRLPVNHRECLYNLIWEKDRPFVVPESISASPFYNEYCNLVQRIRDFRYKLSSQGYEDEALYFLLNCDQIKVISSTNARIDMEIMRERLCMNAQWEIRDIFLKKFKILYSLLPEVFEKAGPSCTRGKCREGKLSCGNPRAIKNLLDEVKK